MQDGPLQRYRQLARRLAPELATEKLVFANYISDWQDYAKAASNCCCGGDACALAMRKASSALHRGSWRRSETYLASRRNATANQRCRLKDRSHALAECWNCQ